MEKRQHRRIPFQRQVYLATSQGEEEIMQASDFSMSGMGVFSHRPVLVGEKVWLRFEVNTLGESRELQIPGEIRHVDMLLDKYVVGVNFLTQ